MKALYAKKWSSGGMLDYRICIFCIMTNFGIQSLTPQCLQLCTSGTSEFKNRIMYLRIAIKFKNRIRLEFNLRI